MESFVTLGKYVTGMFCHFGKVCNKCFVALGNFITGKFCHFGECDKRNSLSFQGTS